MIPKQRQIVEVNFRLPDGKFKNHPVLVISNDCTNEFEETFTAVMLTGTPQNDEYSLKIPENAVSKKLNKQTEIRIHLIQSFMFSDIIQNKNQNIYLKKDFFEKVLKKIKNKIC